MSPSRPSGAPAPWVETPPVHHRLPVYSLDGREAGHLTLPEAWSEPIRPDLIRRAVVAAQSHRRQPYGTSPTAGLRHSVEWSGKGRGVARTPRLMNSMRGAQAPNTVGGRPAHPPKVDRIWAKKINDRERRKAFRSALAATRDAKRCADRGHRVPPNVHLPIVLDDALEAIDSTQEARALLERLKLWDDVARARDHGQYRSGRARRRGRVRRTPKSVLVVTTADGRARGFANLPGVEVVSATRLSTEDLAPGGDAGRLTLFSQSSLRAVNERVEPRDS